jgi:uncharacterized protein (DUF983 family)
VKGTSAEGSGIRCIPYLVSITLSSIVVGSVITLVGVYNPPMWAGIIVFTVGAGMLYTLEVGSSVGTWIGYQILAGAGAGACVQIPFIAVQVALPEKDMPVGNAVAIFFVSLIHHRVVLVFAYPRVRLEHSRWLHQHLNRAKHLLQHAAQAAAHTCTGCQSARYCQRWSDAFSGFSDATAASWRFDSL